MEIIQNSLHVLYLVSVNNNRRANVASETLTGVTQLKIGDVCLLASERSERDSIRGG